MARSYGDRSEHSGFVIKQNFLNTWSNYC